MPLVVKNPSRNFSAPPLCVRSTQTLGVSMTGMYTRCVAPSKDIGFQV